MQKGFEASDKVGQLKLMVEDGKKLDYKGLEDFKSGGFDYYKIIFPKSISSTITKTTTYTTTKTTTKGEDKEREIFEIIENNPSLSVEQISGLVNLSMEGVRYHIKNLKKKKRIKRKGHGKGGSWEII